MNIMIKIFKCNNCNDEFTVNEDERWYVECKCNRCGSHNVRWIK